MVRVSRSKRLLRCIRSARGSVKASESRPGAVVKPERLIERSEAAAEQRVARRTNYERVRALIAGR
jgi:hypothetical protein